MSTFEGQEVTEFLGKLPALTVECPEGYELGTTLDLKVEVRVKGVSLEEDRKGNLVRRHTFAIDSITVTGKEKREEPTQQVEGDVPDSPDLNRPQVERVDTEVHNEEVRRVLEAV